MVRDHKKASYCPVVYLRFLLDGNISGEAMARIGWKNVNGKNKFLHRQSGYLSYLLRGMIGNTLIQPH